MLFVCFLCPWIEWSGHIVFILSVCLSVCLFVCLSVCLPVVNFNLRYKLSTIKRQLGNILNIGDFLQIGRSSLNREILFIICVSFGKLSPESWPESLFNVGSWPGSLFNRWIIYVKLWPSVFLMRVCSYHGLIYSLLFPSSVKAHADLIKRLLRRVIVPGWIMTRVVSQCWIFTQGPNSTWNYDPSTFSPTVENGGWEVSQ